MVQAILLAAAVVAQAPAPGPSPIPKANPIPKTTPATNPAPRTPMGPVAPLPNPDVAIVKQCVVALINEVKLPARVPGQLMQLGVIDGAIVERGQVIGKQDDRDVVYKKAVTEIEAKISKMQSENDVKVKAAKAAEDLAKAELEQGELLAKKNSIAPSELRRLTFAYEKARLEAAAAAVEQTIQQTVVTAREAQLASADDEIQRRLILSPLNGVVERVEKHVGEWLNPGEVVMTLVELEKVRVQGYLNSKEYSAHEVIGKTVVVEVEMARGRLERFEAKIGYAQPRDELSNEYLVWAEIQNRQENGQWIVRAGQRAQMTIKLK